VDITYYKEPWEHGVIDNFFDNNMLSHIYKASKKLVHNFGRTRVKDEIVREYFENKFETKGTNCDLEFIFQKPLGTYRIHDEIPEKKLSVVVYLEPKISHGTSIYDSNKKFVKRIEWARNRAMFFKGQQGITWHSYGNPFKTPRLTFNYFML
jgi:hypothetical protein